MKGKGLIVWKPGGMTKCRGRSVQDDEDEGHRTTSRGRGSFPKLQHLHTPTPTSPIFLPHITSNLPPASPCHRLQIRPPYNPTLKPSSTQPWTSIPNALDRISVTTHWLPPSIDMDLRMRFSLYSKRSPMHSTNSEMVIRSWSSGSGLLSMGCTHTLHSHPVPIHGQCSSPVAALAGFLCSKAD